MESKQVKQLRQLGIIVNKVPFAVEPSLIILLLDVIISYLRFISTEGEVDLKRHLSALVKTFQPYFEEFEIAERLQDRLHDLGQNILNTELLYHIRDIARGGTLSFILDPRETLRLLEFTQSLTNTILDGIFGMNATNILEPPITLTLKPTDLLSNTKEFLDQESEQEWVDESLHQDGSVIDDIAQYETQTKRKSPVRRIPSKKEVRFNGSEPSQSNSNNRSSQSKIQLKSKPSPGFIKPTISSSFKKKVKSLPKRPSYENRIIDADVHYYNRMFSKSKHPFPKEDLIHVLENVGVGARLSKDARNRLWKTQLEAWKTQDQLDLETNVFYNRLKQEMEEDTQREQQRRELQLKELEREAKIETKKEMARLQQLSKLDLRHRHVANVNMNQKLQETTKSLESYNVHRKSLEDQLLTQTVKESLKIQKENILEAYRVQKEELKRNLREKQLREEALKKYQQDQIEMKREKAQRFKKEQEIREKAVLDELRGLKRSEKERLKNRTGVLRQIVQNDGKDTYFRMKDLERELERIRSGRVHLTNDVRSIF